MFDVGADVPLAVAVKDSSGTLVNATTIAVVITLPDGTTVSPAVTNPPAVTGNYVLYYPSVQAGHHSVNWSAATGGTTWAYSSEFDVRPPTTAIVSLADAKVQLSIPAADTSQDAELRDFIDAVTPVIEGIVGPVTPRSVTEWHDGGAAQIVVRNPPIQSVTSVTEFRGNVPYLLATAASPAAATAMSYMWEPSGIITRLNGAAAAAVVYLSSQGLFATFPIGPNSVQVVYTAGEAVIPANVRQAALQLIAIQYQQTQLRSPWDGGQQSEGSMLMGFFVPNKVRELLLPNRRPPSIV